MTTLTPNLTIPNIYTQRINLIKGASTITRIEVYVNSVTGSDASNRGGRLAPYRSLEFALRDVFELLATRQMVRIHLAGSNPHVLSAGLVFPQVMSPDEITLDAEQALWDEQAPLVIQGDPELLYTVEASQILSQVPDPVSGLIVMTTTYLLGLNVLRGKFAIDSLGNIAAIAGNVNTTIQLCESTPMTGPLRIYDSSVNIISPAAPGAPTPTVNLRGGSAPIIFQGVKIIGTSGGAVGLAQGVSALFVGCELDDVVLAMARYELANEGAVRISGSKVGGLSSYSGSFLLENTFQTGNMDQINPMTRIEAIDSIFGESSPVGFGVSTEMSVNSLVMTNCEILNGSSQGIRMVHGLVYLTNVKISNCNDAGLQLEQNASGFVQTLGGEANGAGVIALTGSTLFVSADTNINEGDTNELIVGVNPALNWLDFFDGDAPHSSRDSSHGAAVYQQGEGLNTGAAPREAGRDTEGDTQVLPSDQFLYATTNGAAAVITLPPLALNRGRSFTIKKVDAAAEQVEVTANAEDSIDGAAMVALVNQYDGVTVTAPPTGTDWSITAIPVGGGGATNTINVESGGVLVGTRPTLNFVGATVVDDAINNRVNITIHPNSGVYDCPGTVNLLDFVYISAADTVDKANATSVAKAPCIGVVIEKPTGTTARVMFGAAQVDGFAGLNPGNLYYLTIVDGTISDVSPAAPGNVVQKVGRAINPTTLLVQMTQEFVVL